VTDVRRSVPRRISISHDGRTERASCLRSTLSSSFARSVHCSAINDSTLCHTSTAQTPVISFIVFLAYVCLSSTAAWLFIQFSPFLCYASILSAVKPMDSIVGDFLSRVSTAMLTRVIMSYQLSKFSQRAQTSPKAQSEARPDKVLV